MPKFFIRWRMNPKVPVKTEAELNRAVLLMLEGVKADLQAGLTKDWGMCVDGSGGYLVCEVPSETELFNSLQKYRAYLDFDAMQVLTVEQAIKSRKQTASQTGE